MTEMCASSRMEQAIPSALCWPRLQSWLRMQPASTVEFNHKLRFNFVRKCLGSHHILFLFSFSDLFISLLKIEAFKQDLCGHLKQISSGALWAVCIKAGREPRTGFETHSLNRAAIQGVSMQRLLHKHSHSHSPNIFHRVFQIVYSPGRVDVLPGLGPPGLLGQSTAWRLNTHLGCYTILFHGKSCIKILQSSITLWLRSQHGVGRPGTNSWLCCWPPAWPLVRPLPLSLDAVCVWAVPTEVRGLISNRPFTCAQAHMVIFTNTCTACQVWWKMLGSCLSQGLTAFCGASLTHGAYSLCAKCCLAATGLCLCTFTKIFALLLC